MVAVDCGTNFCGWTVVDSLREWFDLEIENKFLTERRCPYGHAGIEGPDLPR